MQGFSPASAALKGGIETPPRKQGTNSRPRVEPVETGMGGFWTPTRSNMVPILVRRFHLRLMTLFPFGKLRGL